MNSVCSPRLMSSPLGNKLCFALVLVFSIQTPSAYSAAPESIGQAHELTVGPLLENPVGFGDRRPQFSWKLPWNPELLKSQSAYRIVCGQDADNLIDSADLWDSGWVESDQSLFANYNGRQLSSGQRVYWTVQFKDQAGRTSSWSNPTWFELGLLEPSDWSAEWIARKPAPAKPVKAIEILQATYGILDGTDDQRIDITEIIRKRVRQNRLYLRASNQLAGDPAPESAKQLQLEYRFGGTPGSVTMEETEVLYIPVRGDTAPMPHFRRAFTLNRPIERARLYVTAIGLCECYLNGQRVGEDHFLPGWTEYKKRFHVHAYDVTDALRQGSNAIGAILGVGWHPWSLGHRMYDNPAGNTQELLCQLHVTYQDGETEIVRSDGDWKTADGPIRSASFYDGEHYDARLELGPWSEPDYDDSAWLPVETRKQDAQIELTPLPNRPVQEIEELASQSVSEPSPGRFVFDLGQNMVGWARITIPAGPGRRVTLRFAEMLNNDGTIYTENLRSAKVTDSYICRGDGVETWEPRFTFHGFRYVELSGFPEDTEPSNDWVTGVVLHNAMPSTGAFTCSHEKLNRLQSNIRWGQKGNFLAVPTDCPQRDERLGWTGDAQVFAATANYNFNTLAFFEKWCADMRDAQRASGVIPAVVPNVLGGLASPGWGDAAVIIPWETYQSFGYRRILEDNYEMMKRWVAFYRDSPDTKDLIYDGHAFGDWLQPFAENKLNDRGDTPRDLIGTAYFAHSAQLVSKIAAILGKPGDAAQFEAIYQQVRNRFAKKFFSDAGRLTTDRQTQTGYLLALAFDLLPESQRQAALANLVRLIEVEAGGNLRTGFLGTAVIASTLTRYDRSDLAYGMLLNDRYPGWFFSIDQGATTMWERWNSYTKADGFGDASMNSLNHYAYGAIGDWMYENIAGLSAARPGYKRLLIAPQLGGDLAHASAELETPYGAAASRWTRQNDQLQIQVTIPANTTATVRLPDGNKHEVTSGVYDFSAEIP